MSPSPLTEAELRHLYLVKYLTDGEIASRYGLSSGTLSQGAAADITVIDPHETWQADATTFKSKSRNTPFHGWTFTGRPVLTVLGGSITHQQPTE